MITTCIQCASSTVLNASLIQCFDFSHFLYVTCAHCYIFYLSFVCPFSLMTARLIIALSHHSQATVKYKIEAATKNHACKKNYYSDVFLQLQKLWIWSLSDFNFYSFAKINKSNMCPYKICETHFRIFVNNPPNP